MFGPSARNHDIKAALLSLTFCLKPPQEQPYLASFPKPLMNPLKCSCATILMTPLLPRQVLIISSFGANRSILSLPVLLASCLLPPEHVSLSKLPASPSTSQLDRRLSSASSFLSLLPSALPAKGPALQSTSRCMEPAAAYGSPLLPGDSEPPTSLLPHVPIVLLFPRPQNVFGTSLGGLTAPPSRAGSANALSTMAPTGTPLLGHSAQPPSRLSMFPSQPSDSPRHSLDLGMLPRLVPG